MPYLRKAKASPPCAALALALHCAAAAAEGRPTGLSDNQQRELRCGRQCRRRKRAGFAGFGQSHASGRKRLEVSESAERSREQQSHPCCGRVLRSRPARRCSAARMGAYIRVHVRRTVLPSSAPCPSCSTTRRRRCRSPRGPAARAWRRSLPGARTCITYIHMHTHTHTRAHAHMHTHTHTPTHPHTDTDTHTDIYICTHIYLYRPNCIASRLRRSSAERSEAAAGVHRPIRPMGQWTHGHVCARARAAS